MHCHVCTRGCADEIASHTRLRMHGRRELLMAHITHTSFQCQAMHLGNQPQGART